MNIKDSIIKEFEKKFYLQSNSFRSGKNYETAKSFLSESIDKAFLAGRTQSKKDMQNLKKLLKWEELKKEDK